MRLAKRAWAFRWFSALLLMSLTTASGLTFLLIQGPWFNPPTIYVTQGEFEGEGSLDRRLNIYYKFIRRRDCQSTQLRWIWQWRDYDNHQVKFIVPLDMSMIPIASASKEPADLVISYAMPSGIDAGDWFFVSKVMDFCGPLAGLFGPTFRESPPIPIHISFKAEPK